MRRRSIILGICLAAGIYAGTLSAQSTPAVFRITGDVPSPQQFTAEDLAKMTHETVNVKGEDGSNSQWTGVPLRELLAKAGSPSGKELRGKPLAGYVLAKAHDDYQVVFSLGEIDPLFGNEPILVADRRDGKPITGNQGPFRLICPKDQAGARSVRMLETLEVVRLRK